jgi:hypothetical protein
VDIVIYHNPDCGTSRNVLPPISIMRALVRLGVLTLNLDVSAFIIAQLAGMLAAVSTGRWLWRT